MMFMMFIKVIIVFSAGNVRLAAAFPIVVVFGVWSVLVTELMISVPNAKAFSNVESVVRLQPM